MRRLVSASVVAGAVVLSCYAPHYDDCHIACDPAASTDGCPEGFHCAGVACLSDHSSLSTCSAVVQPDAPMASDGSGSGSPCGWPFTPSNFDPCDPSLPAVAATGTYTYMGQTYDVEHVQDFVIGAGSGMTVSSSNPLIIIAEGNVTIDGVLDVSGQGGDPGSPCNAGMGLPSGGFGGGGGGGGFGTAGGSGGGSPISSNLAMGGAAIAPPKLIPLRMGCPGAIGASGGSGAAGGGGGYGGGAVQISAKGSIDISGSILADGAGGGGGGGGSGAGGGGGGGAGGAILLEAHQVTLTAAGHLCAVGGGGGQGGTAMMSTGEDGASGLLCVPGRGGSTSGFGGHGGSAASGTGHGVNGDTGVGSGAGGGGGGGNGKIGIHSAMISKTGSTIVPPPDTWP